VVVAGGTVIASNASHSAFTGISSGTLSMQGGSLVTDQLSLTSRAGRMLFSAGTIQSVSSFVSNGLPFVVGDGIHAATFMLGPGTHVFANGIEVSPNATLRGCNDIIGAVINNGGIVALTNCSTQAEPPSFLQHPVSLTVTQGGAAAFSVSVAGTPAPTLQWRFTPLNGAEIDLPGAVGPVLSLPAVQASDAGSYRVVASNPSGSVTSSGAVLHVLIPPDIVSVSHAGGRTRIEFQSISGLTYFLEFKAHLDDPVWTPIQSVAGTGALLALEDPAATTATRFYRLRVE
jgi:hypothetical protein